MNKEELFRMSGLSGTFDNALPQWWFDQVLPLIRPYNPLELFVWWYPSREDSEYCSSGKPLAISRMFSLALERGELIPKKNLAGLDGSQLIEFLATPTIVEANPQDYR